MIEVQFMEEGKPCIGVVREENIVSMYDVEQENPEEYIMICGEDPLMVHEHFVHFYAIQCDLFETGWGYLRGDVLKPCCDPFVATVDGEQRYIY